MNTHSINTTLVINNYSYINYILIIFILISLIFTFHSKGTTVHKVLGLLLLSIFVVFLWMLQTQFLFIYLVYILAFISAVLMLFLSVVLMLPISTFNQSTTLFKNNIIFLIFSINIDNYIIIKFILLNLIVLFYIYINKNKVIKYINIFNIKTLNLFKSKIKIYTLLTKLYIYIKQFLYKINSIKFPNYLKINIIYLILQYYIKLINSYIYNFFLIIFETIAQIILYSSLFLIVLAPTMVKQTWFIDTLNPSFELSLGLGQLKTLLYGDFSLFLIFSTVVLLVSLFGAAIMTRTEK